MTEDLILPFQSNFGYNNAAPLDVRHLTTSQSRSDGIDHHILPKKLA
ncbi:MAG: hypothetical protein ABJ360_11280 [Roseobacter sp.]